MDGGLTLRGREEGPVGVTGNRLMLLVPQCRISCLMEFFISCVDDRVYVCVCVSLYVFLVCLYSSAERMPLVSRKQKHR